jgi:pilus assembly protein CpaF
VARRGRSELTTTILNEGQVRDLVEKMLKTTGRRVDLSTPFVETNVLLRYRYEANATRGHLRPHVARSKRRRGRCRKAVI